VTAEQGVKAVAVLLGIARVLVLLWVLLWMLISLLGSMASDGCVGDRADACGLIGPAWIALMVGQVATLVLTGLYSDTHRPRRQRVVAMTGGAVAAPVLFLAFGVFVDAQLGI
jgi:hypothetical protein